MTVCLSLGLFLDLYPPVRLTMPYFLVSLCLSVAMSVHLIILSLFHYSGPLCLFDLPALFYASADHSDYDVHVSPCLSDSVCLSVCQSLYPITHPIRSVACICRIVSACLSLCLFV